MTSVCDNLSDVEAVHDEVLDRIARGAFRRQGGLKVARLLQLEPAFFDGVRRDVLAVVAEMAPSDVNRPDHITNWAGPTGETHQYSLYNRTGDFADTSADHDQRTDGKRFHHADRFPDLGRFLAAMPDLLNARIAVLGHGGGLSLHEEQVHRFDGDRVWFRLRVHLPVQTNPDAVLVLDRDVVHLPEGSLYAFNNGCVHSARNLGSSPRVHVLFDLRLTCAALDVLFGPPGPPPGFCRVPADGQAVPVLEQLPRGPYRVSGRAAAHHERLRLARLGVPSWRVQDAYRFALRLRYRRAHRTYAPSN